MKRCLALLFSLLCVCALATDGVLTELDVPYGTAAGKTLHLDVYQPETAAKAPRPGIVILHGGGWAMGDRKDMRFFAEAAVRDGYLAFSVQYRLVFGEENRWPAQLDDVQRAVRWLRANAARWNLDPDRIAAAGTSAGGHLAAMLGVCDTRDNSDTTLAGFSSRVRAVVDHVGPCDLTDDFSQRAYGLAVNQLICNLLGCKPSEHPEIARAASPLFLVDAKSAPMLIVHGARDPLIPPTQGQRLESALQKAGVATHLVVFEDDGHSFEKKVNLERFFRESTAFLRAHLDKQ
jgi:acetyl esterase/lipase